MSQLCASPGLVGTILNRVYEQSVSRSVARVGRAHVATHGMPEGAFQECALAKTLHDLARDLPFAMLHLPRNLVEFRVQHTMAFANQLEAAVEQTHGDVQDGESTDTKDSSSTDSFLKPPSDVGVDADAQLDLDKGADMERYHYVNPYRDDDDASAAPENPVGAATGSTPAEVPEEEVEETPAESVVEKCIDSCKAESGRLFLMQGAATFRVQTGSTVDLGHIEPCPTHKYRRWVVAIVPNAAMDTEEALKELVVRERFGGCPFFVGCGGTGYAKELCIIYQCSEADKHKAKEIIFLVIRISVCVSS